jgi:predicted kinase
LISSDAIRAQLFGADGVQASWLLVWHQVQKQWQQAVEQSDAILYAISCGVRKLRSRL